MLIYQGPCLCSFGQRTKKIREVNFSPLLTACKRTNETAPCSLAIILGTLALDAGIYRGISPVSSHNMSLEIFSATQELTDRPLYVRT